MHLAFISIPAAGHVNPTLAVVAELVRRGHRVTYFTSANLPANFRVQAFFPQLRVLRHAHVFLTHAGMNSTMQALYFGVPLVAVPQQPEQEATASRVELGLGQRLGAEPLTSPKLLSAVSEVSANPHIRQNLAAMSKAVRNAGGPAAAATAIETHLQSPPTRSGLVP
jgi:MGT family glycosyltransferase